MTEKEQPEALRLADCLDRDNKMNWPDYDNTANAAAELRRLTAELEALRGALRKEADRLDFVLLASAFTMQAALDHPGVRYQLLAQDEDENFVALSGERKSFATRREAIDAAIAQAVQS